MSDDLDLRGIDHRHEPDPQFRAALRRRLAAIAAGTDPGWVTAPRDLATIELEPTRAKSASKVSGRRLAAAILAAAAVVVVAVSGVWSSHDPEVITKLDTAVSSSTELVVRPLDPPVECDLTPRYIVDVCPSLAVSPDGTLVALDPTTGTLTWYEEEPRVVPLAPGLLGRPELLGTDENSYLVAIGPHDIAYIAVGGRPLRFVAVAPSGAEITRVDTPGGAPPVYPAATGLVASQIGGQNVELWVPWVDLDGHPITDTRPYPTAKVTDAGIEVHLGEREWLFTEAISAPVLSFLPRSDGGVVLLLEEMLPSDQAGNVQARELFELSPDGTIERYFLDTSSWSFLTVTVLPDGSLIAEQNLQLVRLTPPA